MIFYKLSFSNFTITLANFYALWQIVFNGQLFQIYQGLVLQRYFSA